MRYNVPRSLKRLINKIGSNFSIYRTPLNEYNEPGEPIKLCYGKCLYHEAIYRQLANEYKDHGVTLRNLPGKYVKIIPSDVTITPEGASMGITQADFCGTIVRGDLLMYDNRVYTIITTGDNEATRSAFASFMIEEVKSSAT